MAEVLAWKKTNLIATQAARITKPMVGITEYANSSHPGFRGTIKYRYSDFIVREVSLAREVVKLTDTSDKIAIEGAAVAIEGTAVANSEEALAKAAGGETTVVNGGEKMSGSGAGVSEMEALVGKELTERIIALVKRASEEKESDTKDEDLKHWEVVLEPDADKAKRTAVHRCIRAHFAPLESDSVKVGDAPTAVRVFHPRGKSGAWREGALRGREQPMQRGGGGNERGAKRQRTDSGADRIDPKYKYLRFTLFKENRDTMGAISELCRHTQLAPRRFSYAGTKDRRACTAQFVTIPRADR
jgi:tRNA pseudouridine13 synthase